MLNVEKIKSMTKAAVYENGPEKKNIEISSYFRTDYIGLQMVKSGVAYTAAFCVLTGVWALSEMEELMRMLSHADYIEELVKTFVLLFVSGLAIYECAIYAYYSKKYREAKKSLKGYYSSLQKIHKFYEVQNSAEEAADGEKTL